MKTHRTSFADKGEGIRTPAEIFEFLEDYVIGATKAKKALSVAVYNHYKRLAHNDSPQ